MENPELTAGNSSDQQRNLKLELISPPPRPSRSSATVTMHIPPLGASNGSRSMASVTNRRDSAVLQSARLVKPLWTVTKHKEKWMSFIHAIIRRNRIRRVLEQWRSSAGNPCPTCAAMKLTEAKFIITDYIEYQNQNRQIQKRIENHSPGSTEDNGLGPDGLEFGPAEYRLGTLQEIFSRRAECPFCQLAVGSLLEQCNFYMRHRRQNGETKSQEGKMEGIIEFEIEKELAREFYEQNFTCFVSWQIDGRVAVRSSQTGQLTTRACTRRLRLRWNKDDKTLPELFDTYVILMAPRTGGQGLFLGRSIQSVKTDAALIQRWITFCDKGHGAVCHPQTKQVPLSKTFFGVIDVKDMCLRGLPPDGKYIALSYTWGDQKKTGSQIFQTRKSNIKELLEPNGLRKWLQTIPRTIRDAIGLVTDLGQRYLWVDSICIIQDSDRSWALNSRIMDIVYGNAYLTICAADGDSSSAGLRILRPGETHLQQNIAQYSRDLRLMSNQPTENYIRQAAWNTRGWTFQERLLSPRNVIFAAGRVFFQCRCTARSIDIITEDESARWSIEFKDSPVLMLKKLHDKPLSVYKTSLELYMTRKLSRGKDILAAFTGIGNLVCDALGGELIFGLPSSHFDWALLWEPKDAANRRPDEDNEQFPSWSWCGWRHEIMEYKPSMLSGCEDNLHDWLMHHTWITWYIRDGNGNLRLIWDNNSIAAKRNAAKPVTTASEARWRGYCKQGNGDEAQYDKYGRLITQESKRGQPEDFKLILDECPYGVNISTSTESHLDSSSTEKDMPYLQFFTWRAFFRIRQDRRRPPDESFGVKFGRYSILDYKGDWCGTILLDKFWVRKDPDKPLEFIALSDAKLFSSEEYDGWSHYIPMDQQDSAWDVYFVMLIETEANISRRVGIGKVFKEGFHNSCLPGGKEWKEFILG